jgi:hypothetical protein
VSAIRLAIVFIKFLHSCSNFRVLKQFFESRVSVDPLRFWCIHSIPQFAIRIFSQPLINDGFTLFGRTVVPNIT